MPVLASITKRATTATDVDEIGVLVDELVRDALTPHRGPVFCDFPLDVVFRHGDGDRSRRRRARGRRARSGRGAARRGAHRQRRTSGADRGHGRVLRERVARVAGRGRDAAGAGVRERARTRLPARRSRARLLADTRAAQDRRRRRGRRRRAARLPPVVRFVRRRRGGARRRQSVRARRARDAGRVAGRRPRARSSRRSPTGPGPVADHEPWIARLRDAESAAAAGEIARPRGRQRSDQADPHLRRAAAPARPRRGRRVRRRRLRVVRRQVRRVVRAGLLARPGPVRLPRHGHGLRDRGAGRASRPPSGRDARRRRRRLLVDGRRLARAAQPARS